MFQEASARFAQCLAKKDFYDVLWRQKFTAVHSNPVVNILSIAIIASIACESSGRHLTGTCALLDLLLRLFPVKVNDY